MEGFLSVLGGLGLAASIAFLAWGAALCGLHELSSAVGGPSQSALGDESSASQLRLKV